MGMPCSHSLLMASLLFYYFASTLGSTSADFCGDFREVLGYQSLRFSLTVVAFRN